MKREKPNILIFMTDHGQGAVFSPGHPARTPNATRLAEEGLEFTEAYCPSAHCCPSRASFMTGFMPSVHGIFNNVSNATAIHRGLPEGLGTFSEELGQAGYRRVLCGKWHVSDVKGPQDYGWEERSVTSNRGASAARRQDEWWRHASPDSKAADSARSPGEIVRPGWGNYRLYGLRESLAADRPHPDERVVGAALEALDDVSGGDQPWCVFVGPIGPHDPYVVPRRFLDLYDLDSIELPESYEDDLRDKPNIYRRMRNQFWDQLQDDEIRDAIRHYWAYCSYEDELLGRLLERLDEKGQTDDTLVLLLSDHGDYVGAHGLFLKGVPAFREAYNIPAILRWPSGIESPGRQVDALVSLVDFRPTFLELAGSESDSTKTHGRSLVPYLRGESPQGWRHSLTTQFNGVELYYSQRAVTTPDWKFVYNGFDFDELYDRRVDPAETQNLANDGKHDDVVGELTDEMWRLAKEYDDLMIFNRYGTVAFARRGPIEMSRVTSRPR